MLRIESQAAWELRSTEALFFPGEEGAHAHVSERVYIEGYFDTPSMRSSHPWRCPADRQDDVRAGDKVKREDMILSGESSKPAMSMLP